MTHNPHHLCFACQEQLPEFVLDQLDPATHSEVQTHLNDCEDCRTESQSIHDAWAALAYEPPFVSPPPELIHRVRARIAAESGVTARNPASTIMHATPFVTVDKNRNSRNRDITSILSFVLAGCVLAILTGTTWLMRASHDSTSPSLDLNLISVVTPEAEAELEKLARLQQTFSSPSIQFLDFQELGKSAGTPRAIAAWNAGKRQGHVFALALQPLPTEMSYQLWLVDSQGHSIPAGRLLVNSQGRGGLLVNLPPDGLDLVRVDIRSPSSVADAAAPSDVLMSCVIPKGSGGD